MRLKLKFGACSIYVGALCGLYYTQIYHKSCYKWIFHRFSKTIYATKSLTTLKRMKKYCVLLHHRFKHLAGAVTKISIYIIIFFASSRVSVVEVLILLIVLIVMVYVILMTFVQHLIVDSDYIESCCWLWCWL